MLLINFGKGYTHLSKWFVHSHKFKEKNVVFRIKRPRLSLFYQNIRCCSNTSDKKDNNEEEVPNTTSDTSAPDKSFIKDVLYDQYSTKKKHFYSDTAKKVDYNFIYTKNTFISASRATSDYLLTLEDLEELRTTPVRTAYSHNTSPDPCYLMTDVRKRAVDKWGSMEAIELKLQKRKESMEEDERRRRGLSALIGHLKKERKDMLRDKEDEKLFGSKAQREIMRKGSSKVVLYAFIFNVFIAIIKFVAYYYTGSASMLSEALHSVADCLNQFFLYIGILQSIKKPSPDHPYGWEKSRYIFALISGCGIFFAGCGASVYHGINQLLTPGTLESLNIAYSVLGLSFILEGVTMFMAYRQVARSAAEGGVSFREYFTRGSDPNAVAVLAEDSAALAGIGIASLCLGLSHYTGNPVYDAVGSITIGALLGCVAGFLIQKNADSLVGRSMHPDRLRQIINILENDIMVRSCHDVKATEMGADTVRFKAEINFDGREVTRVHLNQLNLDAVMDELKNINTHEQLERFLLEHGELIVDELGKQVDRIEKNIKKNSPEVRHVDLEIL